MLWVQAEPCLPASPLQPSSRAAFADDFVMEPGRRVATAFCVARSRTLQAGRLVTNHRHAVPILETRSPEPVGSCCCSLLETPSDLPARDAAWVYGFGAMVVVVTARSRKVPGIGGL